MTSLRWPWLGLVNIYAAIFAARPDLTKKSLTPERFTPVFPF